MLGSRREVAYIVISIRSSCSSYQHAVLAGVPSRRTVASTATRGCSRKCLTVFRELTVGLAHRLRLG